MRILTSNIWGNYFSNPVEPRAPGLLKVFNDLQPDVIGIQEANYSWYDCDMFQKMSEDYYFVGTEVSNNNNFVPMAIKKEHELVAKGYERLFDTEDPTKAITWAVIKDKKTGKLAGFCNTHFHYLQGTLEHDMVRCKNALQLCNVMRGISHRFNCPVFCFGDMNCTRASHCFSVVYIVAGVKHLWDMAEEKDTVCTIHGNPVQNEDGSFSGEYPVADHHASIDHILGMGENFTVSQYRVVTDQHALDATDHCPVYVDVIL